MIKVWFLALGLVLVRAGASGAEVNFREREQVAYSAGVTHGLDKEYGAFVVLNAGTRLTLLAPALENAAGYDWMMQPQGRFRCRGTLGGVAFVLYRDGDLLLCRAADSQTTFMVPSYAWNTRRRERHCLFVRRNASGQINFYADGLPAVPAAEYRLDAPGDAPGFELEAIDALQLDELSSTDTPLDDAGAVELYLAMLTRTAQVVLPTLVIPRFTPPEGDAVFEEKSWENAAKFTGFVLMGENRLCERQTVACLGADARGVYVYFKSAIHNPLSGSPKSHDEGFGGDAVEFFLMPGYTETFNFYQFIGNHFGSTYDARIRDRLWNGKWTHLHRVTKEHWISVFLITDYPGMGVMPPKTGDQWRFNLCRDWLVPDGGYLWSEFANTPGGYYNYNAFAGGVYGGDQLPFLRLNAIGTIDPAANLVSADFEAVNPGGKTVRLRADYSFYRPGAYRVTAFKTMELTLPGGGARQAAKLSLPLDKTPGGMVTLLVSDAESSQVIYQQTVTL